MQILEPVEEDVPAGQLAHTVASVHKFEVAPGSAYFPRGHETSPVQPLEVRPVVEPYFPAGQSWQVADPAIE